ncbi:MAG: hypothetical protein ACRD0H_29560 [Actinomycetes bacterium]
MTALRIVLFAFGYPMAIVVIARFVPVVRQRRTRWIVIHHVGVAAIIAGWALAASGRAVVINTAWLVASTGWYLLGGRRTRTREPAPDVGR